VALVLNLQIGHVRPQFHLKFDQHFDTVKHISVALKWQSKTGLGPQSSLEVDIPLLVASEGAPDLEGAGKGKRKDNNAPQGMGTLETRTKKHVQAAANVGDTGDANKETRPSCSKCW
jgi:hypothetical protein